MVTPMAVGGRRRHRHLCITYPNSKKLFLKPKYPSPIERERERERSCVHEIGEVQSELKPETYRKVVESKQREVMQSECKP